jgi:formylglycine-generating enzyme required for sulfatase activity
MERKTDLYAILGLLLAALGCAAGWFALPQFQSLAGSLLANPLFWPLLAVVAVLAVLLPFTDLRALVARLRGLLPGHRPEQAYLTAIYEELNRTPALLVLGGRDEAYRELKILETFSALTLRPEEGSAEARRPAQNPLEDALDMMPQDALASTFLQRAGRSQDMPRAPRDIIFSALAQLALLLPAAALCVALLWSPQAGWPPGWPRIGGALLTALAWLLLARWLHIRLLPALRRRSAERRACSAEPGTPGAEIWANPRLLVRGDPGSGKTTLLRHIAVSCAGERLGRPRGAARVRVRDAYGWPRCPFPIYIPLRALRFAAAQANQALLESYAEALRASGLLGRAPAGCDAPFFARRAARGGCLFLIDAFDELRDAGERQRLGRLIAALPAGPPRNPNRVVVTSRIAGYEGQLRDKKFAHQRLADLDDAQAAAFVRARYAALGPNDAERRAARLIERLPTNPGLRRLSRNPLLLSLAVSLHYRQGGRELPQERHLLYEKAVEMLAYEWERFKDGDAGLAPADERDDLSAKEKLDLLAELAWAMFEQSLGAASETARAVIDGTRAEAVLAATLAGIPAVAADKSGAERERHCRSEAARWLRNLNERGGLLQELGNLPGSSEVEIQFAHLSFQEYLAARAVGDADGPRLRRLKQRWDDPNWREVLLLHAASRPDATPVVQHLLEQNQLAGLLLAGYLLVERPRKLDQGLQDRIRADLLRLAVEDATADQATAREALRVLHDAAVVDRAVLLNAARAARLPAVRAQAIELLAGMAPNTPAPEPPPGDLCELALRVLEQEQDYRPRLAAGFALARGDPRYDGDGWMPEVVKVEMGPFLMGEGDEQHIVDIPYDYWIGTYPVTNAQWRRFVEAGAYTTERYWTKAGWRQYTQPEYWDNTMLNGDNQPVVGVSWFEAVAYCRWLSEMRKQEFYLPSEAEWEKAARGPHGRIYPWGDDWQDGCCNSEEAGIGRTSPVGSFPAGASLYKALDMAGNAWEWCATKYGMPYPYVLEDEWRTSYLEDDTGRSLRGSSWAGSRKGVRGAYRRSLSPRDRINTFGLRVASRSPRPNAES